MTEDILEKAKAADIDLMAITDWGQLRDLFGELIAEVERLRSENKIISDRAAHHEKQDAAEIELLAARIKELEAEVEAKEVERLRSENRELEKTDVWANDVIKEHESLKGQIAAKDAEIERLRSDQDAIMAAWDKDAVEHDARIKELEAWLVEERANLILEQIRGGSIITLQDPDERRANAIRQLQAEGKIGGVKPEYGGQHHCGTQIIREGSGEWHCPKCNPLLTAEQPGPKYDHFRAQLEAMEERMRG